MDRYVLFLATDGCMKIARFNSDVVAVNSGFGPYDHVPTLAEIRKIDIVGNRLMQREEDLKVPFTIVDESYEERLQELADVEVKMICKGFSFEISCVVAAAVLALCVTVWQKGYWSASTMCEILVVLAVLAGMAWVYFSRK